MYLVFKFFFLFPRLITASESPDNPISARGKYLWFDGNATRDRWLKEENRKTGSLEPCFCATSFESHVSGSHTRIGSCQSPENMLAAVFRPALSLHAWQRRRKRKERLAFRLFGVLCTGAQNTGSHLALAEKKKKRDNRTLEPAGDLAEISLSGFASCKIA